MKVLIPLICFILYLNPVYSQFSSTQEEAMQNYSEGNYSEALKSFNKLITLFPNDPKYYYFSGICMVECRTGLEKAVRNLIFAADKAVPRDVYFYLGRALHLQGKFSEAIEAYYKFNQLGTPADIEKLKCSMYLTMAQNGLSVKSKVDITIVDKKPSDSENIYDAINENLKNGKFVNKSGTLFGSGVSKLNLWRYEPLFKENGVMVFGSATKGLAKGNTDVYFQKYNGKSWSRQQSLPSNINTLLNEDFVWFNESEPAIYFSSMGHNSMGGYDIFKSVYNPDSKTWSDPVNLGYPINSPFNDFLFIVDDNQEFAWFVTDRETTGNQLSLVKMKFNKNFTYSPLPGGFKFETQLSVIALPKSPAGKIAEKKVNPEPRTEVKSVEKFISKEIEYPRELSSSKNYNQIISDALTYQLKSDSLGRVIDEYRDKIANSTQEQERNALKTKIFQSDKQAKMYQAKADSLYLKARSFETKTVQKSNTPNQNMGSLAKQAFGENKPVQEQNTSNFNTNNEKTKIIYEFKVMSKSPYKTVSEIPLNQPLPSGVIYRIQMGAFSKVIEPDRFKGIVPISGETVGTSGITKYYAGLFSRLADSEKALIKIKEYGFADAYVVAFINGKSIPINRAKEMENGYN